MSVQLAFPVSPEDFAAYQEKLLGRPLTEHMREALDAWVPVFNDLFQKGQSNDIDGLKESMGYMNQCINKHRADTTLIKFLKAARHWSVYAWKQGTLRREDGESAEKRGVKSTSDADVLR